MVPSRPRIPHWVMHIKILIQNTKDTNQMFQTSDKTHLKVQIPQEVWSKESHSVFMKDYHILIENEPKTWLSWSIQSGFLVCGHFFHMGLSCWAEPFFSSRKQTKCMNYWKINMIWFWAGEWMGWFSPEPSEVGEAKFLWWFWLSKSLLNAVLCWVSLLHYKIMFTLDIGESELP